MPGKRKTADTAGHRIISGEQAVRNMNFTDQRVTITVGEEDQKKVYIPKRLIKSDPTIFREALVRDEQESQRPSRGLFGFLLGERVRQPLVIPRLNDEHSIVLAYAIWLDTSAREIDNDDFHELAEMYLFGQSIESTDFCQAIVTRMRLLSRNGAFPAVTTANRVFKNTLDSAIRECVVDSWIDNGTAASWREAKGKKKPCPGFRDCLIEAFLERREQ